MYAYQKKIGEKRYFIKSVEDLLEAHLKDGFDAEGYEEEAKKMKGDYATNLLQLLKKHEDELFLNREYSIDILEPLQEPEPITVTIDPQLLNKLKTMNFNNIDYWIRLFIPPIYNFDPQIDKIINIEDIPKNRKNLIPDALYTLNVKVTFGNYDFYYQVGAEEDFEKFWLTYNTVKKFKKESDKNGV